MDFVSSLRKVKDGSVLIS